MTQTVLVTGGTGFVGGWCIVELLRAGYAVRTTVRDLGREPALRAAIAREVEPGDRLTVVAADLLADDGWDAAVAGCDYVLHVASPLIATKDEQAVIRPARRRRDAGAARRARRRGRARRLHLLLRRRLLRAPARRRRRSTRRRGPTSAPAG